MPVLKTAQEVQAEIAEDYESKLRVEGALLPDPTALDHGWVPEDEGVRLWPMTLYPDIFNFLSFHPSELKSQDLSDYKLSKAYSYCSTGWLNPLIYHPVSDTSSLSVMQRIYFHISTRIRSRSKGPGAMAPQTAVFSI